MSTTIGMTEFFVMLLRSPQGLCNYFQYSPSLNYLSARPVAALDMH